MAIRSRNDHNFRPHGSTNARALLSLADSCIQESRLVKSCQLSDSLALEGVEDDPFEEVRTLHMAERTCTVLIILRKRNSYTYLHIFYVHMYALCIHTLHKYVCKTHMQEGDPATVEVEELHMLQHFTVPPPPYCDCCLAGVVTGAAVWLVGLHCVGVWRVISEGLTMASSAEQGRSPKTQSGCGPGRRCSFRNSCRKIENDDRLKTTRRYTRGTHRCGVRAARVEDATSVALV